MDYQKIITQMTQSILECVRDMVKDLPYSKHYKAKVVETNSDNPAKYQIQLKGNIHTVTSSVMCEVGDFVWVCVPNGDKKNMFIVCKTK